MAQDQAGVDGLQSRLREFQWDSSESCSSSQSEEDRTSTFQRCKSLPLVQRRRERLRRLRLRPRALCYSLSSESLKSDRSLDLFIDFQSVSTRSKQLLRGLSCESLKSDRSKEQAITFRRRSSLSKPLLRGLSCESLKSDRSKEQAITFRRRSSLPRPLSHSLGFSCESLSNRSMDDPPEFQSTPPRSKQLLRGLSCESLKSDRSKEQAITFRRRFFSALLLSPVSPESLKSSWSMDERPYFSEEPVPHRSHKLVSQSPSLHKDFHHLTATEEHRRRLLARCEPVSEGLEQSAERTQLSSVYTELFISEATGGSTEVELLETQFRKRNYPGTALRLQQLFRSADQTPPPLWLVLTLGVAGVGKTFSVQKFCVDWAQGLENQDLQLVVPLSFREMNLVGRGPCSLMELITAFHPALEQLSPHALSCRKVLLIFDGLDESRLPLDFRCEVISEVTRSSEVSVLLVNIIRGHLLPHALVWITSRPAAANQIPARCVHRVTEVRGFFTDKQKEMFFRRRFSDSQQLHTVLSHLRTSPSLHVMSQIPVFCWISSTVLEHVLETNEKQVLPQIHTESQVLPQTLTESQVLPQTLTQSQVLPQTLTESQVLPQTLTESQVLPQTLTDLYVHFLLVQMLRSRKYHRQKSLVLSSEMTSAECELLLKLGKLALDHLQRGNITFYREDLEEVGLDLTEASVYSGFCTEIFRQESVVFNQSVYCFVHLSVQEFMAALYLQVCFSRGDTEEIRRFLGQWEERSSLHMLLNKALEISLHSESGHLDLFIRFLHGLCAPTSRRLLRALLGPSDHSRSLEKVVYNLRSMATEVLPPDRSVNISHCLTEMKDSRFLQELQDVLRDSSRRLSSTVCSALGYLLQMSEQVLEELDLRKFNTSNEGRRRLLPAIRNCTQGILSELQLDSTHFTVVNSALGSSPSHLLLLDLSQNRILDSDLEDLCEALKNPHCRLQTLRLRGCGLSDITPLLSALRLCPSLREVDLRENSLQERAVQELREIQQSTPRRLLLQIDRSLRPPRPLGPFRPFRSFRSLRPK